MTNLHTSPRIAFRAGKLVGSGTSPEEAAYTLYLKPPELVELRKDFWRNYDAGLLAGRLDAT